MVLIHNGTEGERLGIPRPRWTVGPMGRVHHESPPLYLMPEITLLHPKTVEFKNVAGLEHLIQYHKEELGKAIMSLHKPKSISVIQAISFNLVRLTRELEKRNGKRAQLHVIHGDKKP